MGQVRQDDVNTRIESIVVPLSRADCLTSILFVQWANLAQGGIVMGILTVQMLRIDSDMGMYSHGDPPGAPER